MSLIEIKNLCHRYSGQEVLKNIDMELKKGELLALIGPTGAGKTTLLRLIGLLETPTSGRIYFDGIDVTASGRVRLEIRRRLAFVLQKPVVFNLSVYDNIACGLRWRGQRRGDIKEKVSRILEVIGLSATGNRNARTLSGGEAQRVAIARAIIVEPQILLLDEPTANLDPISVAKIEELISIISRQYKTTIVMATHDMSQGQRLADRIGVLVDGSMVQVGDSRQVFSFPRNRQVAEFVGIGNIIDGVIAASKAGVVTINSGGTVIEAISDYGVGEAVSACIRPEDIILSLSKTKSSARNSFTGQVKEVVLAGSLARVEIDCGLRLVALVTKKSADELKLKSGHRVCASFKASGVHVIKRN
ncbi:MAG: ABC transporter ATP-binding protein [Dehalococcoidia bacterium]|nr:MAG: ABC transporter ATP-binding protein [Dehalococcoidia bacterium]